MFRPNESPPTSSPLRSLGRIALALGVLAAPHLADGRRPGSLLVYPVHRSGAGFTIVSVTNTNTLPAVGWISGGTTNVLFQYLNTVPDPFDPQTAQDCSVFDRLEQLTPADTLSVLTACHNAEDLNGYVVVAATDLFTGAGKEARSFDYLVGSELVIGATGSVHSLNAIPFTSPVTEGAPTDFDADGQYDFDGIEYEGVPDELYGEFVAIAGSSLSLINLTGGPQFTAIAQFDVWNDNEQPLSATRIFRCWMEEPLVSVSPVFQHDYLANNTPDDPGEVDTDCDGQGDLEMGWFKLTGNVSSSSAQSIPDPAFLGALTAGTGFGPPGIFPAISGGRLLWESPEKQYNASFLEFGVTLTVNDPPDTDDPLEEL